MSAVSPTQAILAAAREGRAPGRAECAVLLGLDEHSFEARLVMATADELSRRKFGNEAVLLGQIGLETAPCAGDCKFCSFSRAYGRAGTEALSIDEVRERARAFAAGGDLFALFLMTMHDYDFGFVREAVAAVHEVVPGHTRLVVNLGDFGDVRARALRDLGVSGAYHVLRLREGSDTAIRPAARLRTMDAIREAGLDLWTCLEPVGPEHTSEELVDQMFVGIERGSYQHAAMRRVHLADSPLGEHGQITNLRLALVTAVVALATLGVRETTNIAVHEPNLLGLAAGANAIYAETGANPRDAGASTTSSRGLDMPAARRMLYDAGFTHLRRGDGTRVPLTLEHVERAAA